LVARVYGLKVDEIISVGKRGVSKTNMNEIIPSIFEKWASEKLASYFQGFTYPKDAKGSYHASMNPFLKTEEDIKMKFGAFLENELIPKGFTVHAEQTEIYKSSGRGYPPRPDLSVHEINRADGVWISGSPNPVLTTLRAVIEIKYINYKYPNELFSNGHIEKDILKLKDLSLNVAKFALLLDEGGGISEKYIAATRELAKKVDVKILSNHKELKLC